VGAVNPIGSFRLDRWADVVVTISRRAVFAGVVVLFSGPQLALAYIAFAVACTGVALVLGGRVSSIFASRSYSDARIWLAITRRMPWRPMRFLADAERRGVFQEVGAIFRFRHARVQRQLQDWHDVYRPRARDLWLRYLRVIDRLQARTGDYAYSLAGARDRVEGFRKLAAQNLEEFGPDLVTALSTQAGFLRELGHLDEELEALRQLVTTRRLLAAIDAGASPALAESLGQLAFRLADAGRHDEAAGAMTEAAEIFCRLAAAKSDAFRPHLANSLTWLKRISVKLERPSDADRAVNTIVDSYSELVRAELDRDRLNHVASLTWFAGLLERLGREDDAATEVNEAVTAYAKLPRSGPNTDTAGHAKSLVALAKILEGLGRKGDASRAAAYSADIYRELARLEPAEYGLLLVESLSRLARLYRELGRPEELSAVRGAVSVYRDFAALEWNLSFETVSKLYPLALRLWKLGAQQEAIEAVTIGALMVGVRAQEIPLWIRTGPEFTDRRRPPTRPDSRSFFSWLTRVKGDESWEKARAADWRSLADGHDTRAFLLLLAGQDQESQAEVAKAVDCSQELVKVYRHLASTRPADHLADLADSLDLLAMQLRKGESDEAAAHAAASEAQLIRCQLGALSQ
jgi:tetratricopeptide (TPR) repeat protein